MSLPSSFVLMLRGGGQQWAWRALTLGRENWEVCLRLHSKWVASAGCAKRGGQPWESYKDIDRWQRSCFGLVFNLNILWLYLVSVGGKPNAWVCGVMCLWLPSAWLSLVANLGTDDISSSAGSVCSVGSDPCLGISVPSEQQFITYYWVILFAP